ncbi:MAG: hypothetical protein A3J93_02895 [Candidatus Magasanikbacteria bacterium RIFOXYC2_FULL_42_28]|uniref:Glycerophosphoryl diester phosphodiesterase membrane domain-containing protein n=1 Tax=Candidatus Magasanikbacteria bacterium RIFOXYC2_FULL_42_28 TaxID=1798704 RepID=A0A1F6NU62_9BACT|nr:MAG: hypothetical protein A3J93_02895 [Candidatus Magasanikbacteria bacterium RIFOXYC2_FULL_42_28]
MLISTTDIIKQSTALYLKHFKQIWAYLIISLAPAVILAMLAFATISLEVNSITNVTWDDIILAMLYLIGLLVSFWAYLGLIKTFDQIIKNAPIAGVKNNLNLAGKIILPAIWISFLTGLITLVGALLFVIPGIIFMVWYHFSLYALVADGERGTTAMKMSKNLATNRWWAVLWRLLAPTVLFTVIGGFLQWLIKQIIFWFPDISIIQLQIANGFADRIIGLLILPLLIATGLILYENLKANPVNSIPPTV